MKARHVEPVGDVLLVLDPFQGLKPFLVRVLVKEMKIVIVKAAKSVVDHVIFNRQEVDEFFVPVQCDGQIYYSSCLMVSEWSRKYLVSL